MEWLLPAVIATLVNTIVLFLVYLFLYYRDRTVFLRLWSIAWLLYAARFIFMLLIIRGGESPFLFAANQLAALYSAVLLMAGNFIWLKKRISPVWIIVTVLISLWIVVSIFMDFSFMLITLPSFSLIGVIFIVSGFLLLGYQGKVTFGNRVTAAAFILWGIHKIDYPFLKTVEWFAPWGYLIAAALSIIVAIGMVLIYLDSIRINLLAANERFVQLAENIPQVFWIISPGYDKLFYISPSYEKVWGRSCEDLFKNPLEWYESIVEGDRNAVGEVVKGIAESEGPIEFPEYRIIRPDGEVRVIDARAFPVRDENKKLYRIAGIAEDVTAKKKAFEIFLQTEKLMTVGGLAAGMAHEINNPLSIITQGAQLIKRRFDASSDAVQNFIERGECSPEGFDQLKSDLKIEKYINNILDAGERASKIVMNMLSFSRPRSSTRDIADLNELVDRCINLVSSEYDLSKKYDFKNITVIRDYQENLPPIPCIKSEIEQVVINILKNAAHAFLKQEKKNDRNIIEISTFLTNSLFHLTISDNGPGMDRETRSKIFEPFYTTKEEGEGTGLGMFVSYFIITSKHQGTIRIESEKGAGTKFVIALPAE